jgi:hypothetical protein
LFFQNKLSEDRQGEARGRESETPAFVFLPDTPKSLAPAADLTKLLKRAGTTRQPSRPTKYPIKSLELKCSFRRPRKKNAKIGFNISKSTKVGRSFTDQDFFMAFVCLSSKEPEPTITRVLSDPQAFVRGEGNHIYALFTCGSLLTVNAPSWTLSGTGTKLNQNDIQTIEASGFLVLDVELVDDQFCLFTAGRNPQKFSLLSAMRVASAKLDLTRPVYCSKTYINSPIGYVCCTTCGAMHQREVPERHKRACRSASLIN